MFRNIIAISIAFVIFSASGNKAHADDPSIHWKKLTTKNFTITFPSEYRNTAQRVASMAEEAHRLLVPLMGHKTASPTHIVISSYTDQANGSATVYFRKTIRLFLTFPSDISELSDFDDWLWILIVHEYTHILHMDTMGQLPRLINKIFGQLWVPNSLLPTWVVESMAVYSETKFSSVGRNRSSIYSMYLRASVLDNQLLSLAQITSAPIPYPHGTIPYLYGSRFLWYLARKYSDSTLKHFSASYGSTLIPFGVNKSARKAFGRTFVELYKEFSAFLHKQVATFVAPVRDRGIRRGQAITRGGEFKFYPVFHPTDPTTLVYIGHDGHSPNALHLVKITGAGQVIHHERLHGRMIGPGRPSWGNNSLWFHNLEMHKATYSFNDVYQLRLGTKSFRRVTRGGRISSPDFSFRKKVLVAVKSSATSSDLVQLNTRGKVDKVILRGAQYEQFYTPSLSPGGDEVVFSRYKSGKRDICLYNLKTNTLTSITNDRAMDTGPVFSPDGAYILFSSDRTEIFNIYAYHLKTGALFQVTNVLNGAFAPSLSADGRLLAYAGYTSKGYEIFILPFSPRAFLNPLEPLPVREAAHFMPRGPTYKISDYSPLPYLSPVAWFADWGYTVSNAASLTMMGFDPLNHHSWYMTANYSPQEELGELYLSYGNNQTPIPVEVSLTTGQYNKNNMNVNEAWHQYPWNYFKGEVAATFPFVSQMRQTLAGYLYGSAYRGIPREERPVPRPDSPLPVWPEGSWRASVKAGGYYFSGASSTYALDWEKGIYLSMYAEALFYSTLDSPRFNVKSDLLWRTKLPFGRHTVLSTRFALGASSNYDGHGFLVGGSSVSSTMRMRPWSDPVNLVRGFSDYSKDGDHYYTANIYVTFPLRWIDVGFETLPFYLRRLHAKIFLDVGDVVGPEFQFSRPLVGAGAEVRLTMIQAWAVSTDLILGISRGLGERGSWGFYFSFGSPLPNTIM